MIIRMMANFFFTPWTNKSSLFQNLFILKKISRSPIFHVRRNTAIRAIYRSRTKKQMKRPIKTEHATIQHALTQRYCFSISGIVHPGILLTNFQNKQRHYGTMVQQRSNFLREQCKTSSPCGTRLRSDRELVLRRDDFRYHVGYSHSQLNPMLYATMFVLWIHNKSIVFSLFSRILLFLSLYVLKYQRIVSEWFYIVKFKSTHRKYRGFKY